MLGLSQLLPTEVLVIEAVRELDALDVQFGLGGDDIGLVDTTQGTAIQVVGAWKKADPSINSFSASTVFITLPHTSVLTAQL